MSTPMAADMPLATGSEPEVLALWLAGAAGRLLLHRPGEPGLVRLIRGILPEGEAQALSQAIADAGGELFQRLAGPAAATPLGRIAAGCRLCAFDLDLLSLAVLPCLDEDAALAVAAIMGGERRLSLGVALKLLVGELGFPAPVRQAVRESPLWRHGLLRPASPHAAPLERRLDPSESLLAGLDGAAPERIGDGWSVQRLYAAPGPTTPLPAAAQRLADLWDDGVVHLAGPVGQAEQLLITAAQGGPCLLLNAPATEEPEAPWAEATLIALATGARVALRTEALHLTAPPPWLPPSPVIAPGGFALRGPEARSYRIDLPGNDPLALAAAWRATLGLGEAEADALAAHTWVDPERIATIASGLPSGLGVAEIRAALAALAPTQPVRLANRRHPQVAWSRLVVAAETRERLDDLVRRVERRVTVQLRWGMTRGERGRGVIGLLHGESGTGKTLAAEALATRLALPLLAVDLSLVVSKYIGETEKNLAELFAAAEGYSAILFFDEADALFGRRTNVQDAHDRYANIEVNFLLQRLESFEGIALLSTNLLQGVDEAFMRRFDQVIQFPRPTVAERCALWEAHLPTGRVAPEVAVVTLAERFELTGGEIRNAALGAAFSAAAGDGVINGVLLERAVAEELNKKGRPFPGH